MSKKIPFALILALISLFLMGAKPASKGKTKPTPTVEPVTIGVKVQATPAPVAIDENDKSPNKPKLESLLKVKSIKRVTEDADIITNSEWLDNDDFAFVNGAVIRTPLNFARARITDFSLYPKMSDAIKKWDYNPATQIVEAEGEAGGLKMHSWIKINQRYWDELEFHIIAGDLAGFKIKAYLWDKVGERSGQTLIVGKGVLPKGRKMFSSVIALVFKPVSEVVIGVATKNFRSYIEEEYKKQKTQAK